MSTRSSTIVLIALALFQGLLTPLAQAERRGISLSQTRVVFNSSTSGTTITLRNHSNQAWLARAQVLMAPDSTKAAPFMVTPPLFRLEPNSQSSVRILRHGTEALPADQESLFYLSFLTIPSSPASDESSSMSASARVTAGIETVIKLFYRPTGLSPTPQEAAQKLTVSQKKNGVIVSNPTPYYLTLSSLSLDGVPVDIRRTGSMVAPFTTNHYPASGHPGKASWTVINDYGGISPLYHTFVSGREAN